jgi:hypothetical protein
MNCLFLSVFTTGAEKGKQKQKNVWIMMREIFSSPMLLQVNTVGTAERRLFLQPCVRTVREQIFSRNDDTKKCQYKPQRWSPAKARVSVYACGLLVTEG